MYETTIPWPKLEDPYTHRTAQELIAQQYNKSIFNKNFDEDEGNNISTCTMLNQITTLIWEDQIAYPFIAQYQPIWMKTTLYKDSENIMLFMHNPLVSFLKEDSWFDIKAITSCDKLWPSNMLKTQREAIVLHTLLCAKKPKNISPIIPSNMEDLLNNLLAEKKRFCSQEELMQNTVKFNKKIYTTYTWWKNIPDDIQACFAKIIQVFHSTNTAAKISLLFQNIKQSIEKYQATAEEQTLYLCFGEQILLQLPTNCPRDKVIIPSCIDLAKAYAMLHTINREDLTRAGIVIQESLTPIFFNSAKIEKNRLSILLPKTAYLTLESLITNIVNSPLDTRNYLEVVYLPKRKQLRMQYGKEPRPLVCNENLIQTLKTFHQLHYQAKKFTTQHNLQPHNLLIAMQFPKVSSPRHKPYPTGCIEYHFTWKNNQILGRLLMHSLKEVVYVCPHTESNCELVDALIHWHIILENLPQYLQNIFQSDLFLLKEFIVAYTWGSDINNDAMDYFPSALHSAYQLTKLIYLSLYPEEENIIGNQNYNDLKKTINRNSIEEFIQKTEFWGKTSRYTLIEKILFPSEKERLKILTQQKSVRSEKYRTLEQTKNIELRQNKESDSTLDGYTTSTPPSSSYISLGATPTPENISTSNDSFDSSSDDDDSGFSTTWKSVPGLEDIIEILENTINKPQITIYTKILTSQVEKDLIFDTPSVRSVSLFHSEIPYPSILKKP